MAPVPSTTGTVRSSTDATFNAAGTAITFAFDAGTDTDRFLIVSVTFDGPSAHTLGDTAVTYNGVAMTPAAATSAGNNCKKRTYGLVAPATGSNTVSVDPSGGIGDEDAIIEVYCYSGVNQVTPYDWMTPTQATDGSAPYESLMTVTGATGDLIWVSHGGRGASVSGGTATNFTERLDNVAGASNIACVSGDVASAASVATSVSWAGLVSVDYCVHAMNLNANGAAAALTGTAATSMTEQRVRDGGYTIILTLTGDTFVASGSTFDAQRQAIINGLDSAQAEAGGWDAVVKAGLAVSTVVRTSNTVCTITLSAFTAYQITATETITATIPAAALTGGVAIVAAPTFTITRGAGDLVQPVGVTNASGVPTTSSGSFTTDRTGLTRFVATVGGVELPTVIVVTAR